MHTSDLHSELPAAEYHLPRPHIEDFDCYRKALSAFVGYKKSLNPRLSYRRLSQMLGRKIPGLIQDVMKGARNLDEEQASGLANIFGLDELELRYFVALVKYQDRENHDAELHDKILSLRFELLLVRIERNEIGVFTDWYLAPIILLSSLPDYQESASWIVAKLKGRISEQEALTAIHMLRKISYLKKRTAPNRKSRTLLMDSSAEKKINPYHAKVWSAWATHFPTASREHSFTWTSSILLPRSEVQNLKKRLEEFSKEITARGSIHEPAEDDQVLQLGVYMLTLNAD